MRKENSFLEEMIASGQLKLTGLSDTRNAGGGLPTGGRQTLAKSVKTPSDPQNIYFSTELIACEDGNKQRNLSVFFVNKHRGIVRQLSDSEGFIQNFPGIVYEPEWECYLKLRPRTGNVRQGARFTELTDGRRIMIWTLQKRGMRWMDSDGFGWEDEREIRLYTPIDEDGCFTGPFRFYELDGVPYGFESLSGEG